MKKSELKMMIRQVVREEIKLGLKELISELKQPIKSKSTKSKVQEKKKNYSNNSILNDVLNETASDDEWKTLGGGTYDSSKMNDLVKSNMGITQNDIAADTAIAAGVNPNSVPKHLEKALTKDYRSLLKATDAKAKQKRNI